MASASFQRMLAFYCQPALAIRSAREDAPSVQTFWRNVHVTMVFQPENHSSLTHDQFISLKCSYDLTNRQVILCTLSSTTVFLSHCLDNFCATIKLILLSKKRHCKSEVQGPRRSETLSQKSTGALVRDQTHYQANVLLYCDQQCFFLFLQNNNHVDDLFTDLCDGRLLICLLETISGDKLGKIGMNLLDNKILCTLQMRVC